MKSFLDFGDTDIANLASLGPVFAEHGGKITDEFYEILDRYPETAKLLVGRIDALKTTHKRYLGELFAGDYGETYFQNRMRVGHTHVRVGLDPYFVEAVMSFLRTAGMLTIRGAFADPAQATALTASYMKVLDLDLLVINLAYSEERLSRLTKFTGMSRKLLETCIQRAT
ncbi:MAG: protoglobin domain-containing protein [Pseudomonadota bacterium]|nr:protoglobin domain-containing protein [Pseudomonadota bacterium]